jgi:hypothetical protein
MRRIEFTTLRYAESRKGSKLIKHYLTAFSYLLRGGILIAPIETRTKDRI